MSGSVASPFRQPKAVFAVAFACVVSFMGIGLVDPILPAISDELHASPSEVTLLFTSYLVVTAVAMLITNWVSSRLGAKKTLIAGLVLIVVFSALAGAAPSVNEIIGFRAGWGVGNALFIATSLAVIVASASGDFAGAIVLYETALGVGIAIGPLLGGTLGEISWRGPFYGVAVLMAIALIATVVLVEPTPKPARKTGLSAPLRALRHRGLLTMSLTALCYNWAFFTVLGYAPFPMGLSPIRLGLVFTGWGILVAVFAVFGAPRLQASLGIARTMYLNLAAFAVVVLVIAIGTTDRAVLIPAVIASGIFIGVNNTITTQAVMTVSPVEKPVASAAYSFVRFIGGGLAPYAAGRMVLAVNIHFPFFIAVGAIAVGIAILSTAHSLLTEAEHVQAEHVPADTGPAAPVLVPVAASAIAADGTADEWRELASLRLAGLLAAAAADHGPQVLGEVLQRGQRGDQGGLLLGRQARHAFGQDRGSLRGDALIGLLPFGGDLDPGGAEVFGVAQPPDQAERVELADDPGQHGRVEALDLGEFGETERAAVGDDAEHGGLGRGQSLPHRGRVQLPREPQDDPPQADDGLVVHARRPPPLPLWFRSIIAVRGGHRYSHGGYSRSASQACTSVQSVARMTSEALITAVTWLPSVRPSCLTASTVIEATSRVPLASSSTLAIASPLLMLMTRAGIWFRALSGMIGTPVVVGLWRFYRSPLELLCPDCAIRPAT
jgi:MFS family permease